jgi:ABC-2 type transport system permease protein
VTDVTERTSEPPRLRVRQRARELWHSREILWNLVRKELKVKYTASVLGAVWSLLNPVVFLAVFTFVTTVLKGGIPNYPAFLLSGLLAWNLFSVSLSNGAQSVIANANLVKKVYFPREILPLGTVGVCLVDFVLQSAVLVVFFLVSGYGFQLGAVWLYPFAFVALLLITTAFTLFVSSLNVRYRDVQHLIGLALLVWFWMTPIVYPAGLVQDRLTDPSAPWSPHLWTLYLLNPLVPIVSGFQRALYAVVSPPLVDRATGAVTTVHVLPAAGAAWLAGVIAVVLALATVMLLLTWRLFFHLSGDFAEEL